MRRNSAKLSATLATSASAIGDLTRRDLAPPGRAADCLPQGGTPPPARLFFTAPWVSSVLSLSISATSATLICTIVFGIVCFSSLNTDMRNCVADSVLLESFGVILEGLEPSWAALGVS